MWYLEEKIIVEYEINQQFFFNQKLTLLRKGEEANS